MDDEAGKAAIEKLNGSEIGGRKAVINEARPREDRPRNGFRPRGERK
jgi:RNA recognition motif-containing protein